MYGQEPAGFGVCIAVLRLCEHGQHGRVPVVAVDNVGRKAEVRYRIQNGAGEKGILFALLVAALINFVAEIKLIIDQINAHAVKLQPLYAAILRAPAEVDIKIEHMLDPVCVFILNAAVIRSYYHCVDPELL